jgi:hypothetical protein
LKQLQLPQVKMLLAQLRLLELIQKEQTQLLHKPLHKLPLRLRLKLQMEFRKLFQKQQEKLLLQWQKLLPALLLKLLK